MFIFFSLVTIAVSILWFYTLNSKNKSFDKKQIQRTSRLFIIGGGILFPSITILVILFFGIPVGNHILSHPEKNIMRIDVIGHQWFWEIHYPDEKITLMNELHLPLNQPVNMYVTSHDVIHSFWIPRLNGKVDAIPGHINILRLKATKPGNLRGQCAEFCGRRHALMILNIKVHEIDSFNKWVQTQQDDAVLSKKAVLHSKHQKTINPQERY